MKNKDNMARINRYICIQNLNNITTDDFKDLEITTNDLRKINNKKIYL